MLIRCPTCSSGYDIAPTLLREGRILRCAHCRDAWMHRPDLPDAPEIAGTFRFSRTAAPVAATTPRRRRPALRLPAGAAASLLLAALFGGAFSAVAGKERVVAAFPPSQAVFATLGLPVNLSGLGLVDVRSTVVSGDGPPVLTLEGRIANLRREATPVPALRIAVRDGSRRELYHWTVPAPKDRLAAGETVEFRSRLTTPPRDGQDLTVGFVEPSRRLEASQGDR